MKFLKNVYESGFALALLLIVLHYVVYFLNMPFLLVIAATVFLVMVTVMMYGNGEQFELVEKIWFPWGTDNAHGKSMLGVFIVSLLLFLSLIMEYFIVVFIQGQA